MSKKRSRKQRQRQRRTHDRRKQAALPRTVARRERLALSGSWMEHMMRRLAASAGEPINVLERLPTFPPAIVSYGEQQKRRRSIAELQDLAAKHFETAGRFFQREEYDAALPEYQRCIAVWPEGMVGSAAIYNLGQCYANLGQFNEARQALEFYAELEPRDPDVYMPLAQIALEEGRYEDCIALSEKGHRLRKGRSARGMCNWARAYYELGDLDISIRILEEAIRIEPNWPLPYQSLGSCYEDKLDLKRAARYYRKAVELDPTNISARESLERVEAGHFIARLLPSDAEVLEFLDPDLIEEDNDD